MKSQKNTKSQKGASFMENSKQLYIITTELSDGRKHQPMYLSKEEIQLLNYDRNEFDRNVSSAFYFIAEREE